MRRGIGIGCLAVLFAGLAVPARADFIVSIGNAKGGSNVDIPQGGTGLIDVFLTSNATSAPDMLNNYGFTLLITPLTVGELMFSSSQNFSYLNASPSPGPRYIFYGDSSDQMTSSPGGTVANSGPPNGYTNDTFIGSDSTNSGTPVSLSSTNTPVLLATLTLDASITSQGEKFGISLGPPSGNGSMAGGAKTFFDVIDFNTGGETSAVPFTSTSGTVTIIGASVPEPASIVSGLTALGFLVGIHGARRLRCPWRQVA